MTPCSDLRLDHAAYLFIQSMRQAAIDRARKRDGGEPACTLEVTAHGNLTCHARPDAKTTEGVQTWHHHFELNGQPISHAHAERIAKCELRAMAPQP